ncbi:sensor histidine kinase [Phenylobacterium sp.]|uniref:sensor histidine kinase n=1 Tax=Phenylobacterium sp. TaxID=1871053 RepID=UPI00272F67AD|nr:histidine kinase dimerization/phosphoacceptor domain -containing protein [Phenylobacterium sp.]MDP1618592.1 histidine kinase dimerization/phosphoacceptor domain -containing protein [Phenylobacterium sp.]MDP1989157.1 histidine kinase dimerization/phosphoacceptor domain -containing protein [Phenylobacterium sp.]
MRFFQQNVVLAYGLAILSTVLAFYVRWILDGVLPPGFPYLTFFPAVILTAFLAGLWPGILCAVLSGLAAWWFFIPPIGFSLSAASGLTLVFFVFVVAVDITVIELMRRAMTSLGAEQALTAQLYERQRVMFQELQHRVANNMTFVAALLQLKKRTIDSPQAAAALDEARNRLVTMAQIHRRLYDPASLELSLGASLQELCDDLVQAAGVTGVACSVRAQGVDLDTPRQVTLSLLVAEVVTNSLKHAFAGRPAGLITIDLAPLSDGRAALLITDDGPGFPGAAPDLESRSSLGFGIMQSLAGQLDGALEFPPGAGAQVRLVFPA